MLDIFSDIFATFQNLFEVIPRDLEEYDIGVFIQGALLFALFYFPSRWFKAYLIRLFLFVFGLSIFWNVCSRDSILYTYDFYAGIAIFLPHIEIVELTYLILKERTLFIYDRLVTLVLLLLSPFLWLYGRLAKVAHFFKARQEQKQYKDEFRQRQEEEYEKEQARHDDEDIRRQESQKQYRRQKQEKRYHQEERKEKERPKTYSRWDSSDPYEVLGIDSDVTKQDIKKAYRNLSKIYHPDLTLTQKEKHQIIFQKINSAYGKIKT